MSYFDARSHGLNLNQRPVMRDINAHVTRIYAEHWKLIGQNLKVQNLDIIEINHHSHPRRSQECFKRMIDAWLRIDPNATWEKLQNAINKAIEQEYGPLATDHTEPAGSTAAALPSSSQATSPSKAVTIVAEGLKNEQSHQQRETTKTDHEEKVDDDESQCSKKKGDKRSCSWDDDDERSATRVKRSKQNPDDETNVNDESDTGNQDNTTDETKKSKYTQIEKKAPIYAVVINNHTFDKKKELSTLHGSIKDVKRLKVLADYGLEFCVCLENCKAEEMEGILKVVASSDKIKENLRGATKCEDINAALQEFTRNKDAKIALKQLTTEECKFALENVTKSKEMKEAVIEILKKPLSHYNGLIVFIMTHGDEGGKLYGKDGKTVILNKIASYFNATNCPALTDMPKIFVIQACRGSEDDHGATKATKGATNKNRKQRNATFGIIPNEADFLFAYSTPENHVSWVKEDGSPFIRSFVEVLNERLNKEHLEEALLVVKERVAEEDFHSDGQCYKQMPSVVSQMRYKVWFHKET